MSHLNESALRRLVDEPLALAEPQRRHLETCDRCRSLAAALGADAEAAAALLAVPDARPDVDAALARFHATAGAAGPVRVHERLLDRVGAALRINPARALRPLAVTGFTAGLAATLVATGTAQGALQIFSPKAVQPVQVSPRLASFRGIPDLSAYGTVHPLQDPRLTHAGSLADAQAQSGLTLLRPGTLPRDASPSADWWVVSHFAGSFTFDAAKAAQAAAASGHTLPPLPSGLDGTTLTVDVGPGVVTTYPPAVQTGAGAATGGDGGGLGSFLSHLPALAVVQMTTPKVTSTGLSVRQLESALLSFPGIPEDLKAQIRAIGDPSTTLPIPIPTSGVTTRQVQVQGVTAVAVGDNTGIGAGVIWIKNGQVLAVAGTEPMDEVIAVARSLHQ